MANKLTFPFRHEFNRDDYQGIGLDVVLSANGLEVGLEAYLDTGAAYCFFQHGYGESLEINVRSGNRERIKTVNGYSEVYGHFLKVRVGHLEVESMVYFFDQMTIGKNVLGRGGFIDKMGLGLLLYDSLLFYGHYDNTKVSSS